MRGDAVPYKPRPIAFLEPVEKSRNLPSPRL